MVFAIALVFVLIFSSVYLIRQWWTRELAGDEDDPDRTQ